MAENAMEEEFYHSDTFVSDNEELDVSRKKVLSQPIIRHKNKINAKHVYGSTGRIQRNNNRRMPNRQPHPVHLDATAQRILSARNHKIVDQSNAIHYLTKQMEELKNENKTLKTQSVRQDKALNKIFTKQSDLPEIFKQHEAEVLSLKELLRRSKENLTSEMKQRKERDNEILKLHDSLTKANQLIEDKSLGERSALQLQKRDLQEQLSDKDKYLETLNRQKEASEKCYKREMRTLRNEIKSHLSHCEDLKKELALVKNNLKEKEKLLEIQNIYSHRFKVPYKLSGLQSDPLLDKLDLNSASHEKDEKYDAEIDLSSKVSAVLSVSVIDEEKIKQDIRQILEEEILSGRIKALEIKKKSPHIQPAAHSSKSADGRSMIQDSYNTDRAIESDIFDRDQSTQVVDQFSDNELDHDAEDRERIRKQALLYKLKELDVAIEKTDESERLLYSYPRDNDYLTGDRPVSEIETISTHNVPQTMTQYKVSNSQHQSNTIKRSQVEASHNQRNNSNLVPVRDETLPPLSVDDKKRKEGELLSELFGENFTPQTFVHGKPFMLGPRHSRVGSLLWEADNNSKTMNGPRNLQMSLESNQTEDIEQIVL